MKKKIIKGILGFMVVVSVLLGGVYAAAASGFIKFPSGAWFDYSYVDKASLNVYSGAITSEGPFVKPEQLIESVTDFDGNNVDISNVEITYKNLVYDKNLKKHIYVPISKDDALQEDGTLDLEKNEQMAITFSYTYPSKDVLSSVVDSTIQKTVEIELGGF